jgi:hypothetical protein
MKKPVEKITDDDILSIAALRGFVATDERQSTEFRHAELSKGKLGTD